jgi:hypothetical protein
MPAAPGVLDWRDQFEPLSGQRLPDDANIIVRDHLLAKLQVVE